MLEELRGNPLLAGLSVVILSSSSSPRERAAVERLHVARHIVKPPNLEEFLRIDLEVQELLGLSRAQGAGELRKIVVDSRLPCNLPPPPRPIPV